MMKPRRTVMTRLSSAFALCWITAGVCRGFLLSTPQLTRSHNDVHIQQSTTKQPRTWLRENNDGAFELSNALARFDKQWKLQQRAKRGPSRWTKLVLNEDPGAKSEDPFIEVPPENTRNQDFVYLLEPPNKSNPSCLIVFIGGAGLGSFPQVAYNEFLLRLSDRLNAAILTAPYQIGLDHFSLAKKVGELNRQAMLHCEDDPTRLYSSKLPTYCLAHSLGCKLATIYMAATGQDYEGIGFLSFNNFGFSQTVGMARDFAQEIRKNTRSGVGAGFAGMNNDLGGGMESNTINSIFGFAESLLGSIGIDFTPTSTETERIIQLKYDEGLQAKTRLFVFDDDNLDSSQSFLKSCQGLGPSVSSLPGTHLTPVYFRFGLEDLPEEAREMAKEGLGGFQTASFGNEEELNTLVDEVCGFVLGKEPSRKLEQALLTGADENDDSTGD